MDETLDAEQHAARAAARRRRALRDRLLAAEDRADIVVLGGSNGELYRGRVSSVGIDHVELSEAGRTVVVVLAHIVALELPR